MDERDKLYRVLRYFLIALFAYFVGLPLLAMIAYLLIEFFN